MGKEGNAQKVVRDIWPRTRMGFSAEEKVRILFKSLPSVRKSHPNPCRVVSFELP